MSEIEMSCYCLTNKGGREVNEDSTAVARTPEGACCILADGLGGHGMGEVASRLVCDEAARMFRERNGGTVEAYLRTAFETAQACLMAAQEERGAQDKMKTTMVVLATDESTVQWGHIGDSRLYYFKNNRLVSRTLDHSVPQMLVASGEIREKDIRHHEDRNRLLRVMGIPWRKKTYEIAPPIPFDENQAFLLCSDGFWEYIEEAEMAAFLARSATPRQWLERMEQEVQKNGIGKNMDNYSAVGLFTGGTKQPRKWFEFWK